MEKITIIDNRNSHDYDYCYYCEKREIDMINECPICGVKISPNMICAINARDYMYMQLECPHCNEVFTIKYKIYATIKAYDGYEYEFCSIYPKNIDEKKFYNKIHDISKEFIDIYNQARAAENYGLDKVCGIAYRKSLEFLIKDYLKHKEPHKKEEIERKPLGQCINDIENISIKKMARGATWLGNDETHYNKKWENKDISDLKNLIDLTLSWMELELKTEEYTSDMEL